MEKDNCELLFEYLRSILYDQQIHALDVKELDEPYQKLGKGLAFLQQAVEEMLAYTEDLSRGNLSGAYPSRDNFSCCSKQYPCFVHPPPQSILSFCASSPQADHYIPQ